MTKSKMTIAYCNCLRYKSVQYLKHTIRMLLGIVVSQNLIVLSVATRIADYRTITSLRLSHTSDVRYTLGYEIRVISWPTNRGYYIIHGLRYVDLNRYLFGNLLRVHKLLPDPRTATRLNDFTTRMQSYILVLGQKNTR